ncbi:MAG: ATP-binding protein, partial [Nitrospirota bacterium]
LSNAIKYTERGRVQVACGLRDGFVRTTITDTGIGIANEDLPKLFRPFHQVESGLTRRYDGTGLGLSISKKLVELLRGNIEVESELGKGSSFSFTLPADRGTP